MTTEFTYDGEVSRIASDYGAEASVRSWPTFLWMSC